MFKAKIDCFDGSFEFLSNFYKTPVVFDDVTYPTLEHAYQAAKTFDLNEREKIRLVKTPGKAKGLGRSVKLRDDWEVVKDSIMKELLISKFHINEDIRRKLINTKCMYLEEGNTWGDTYWGVCKGKGENKLGKLLMGIRQMCL